MEKHVHWTMKTVRVNVKLLYLSHSCVSITIVDRCKGISVEGWLMYSLCQGPKDIHAGFKKDSASFCHCVIKDGSPFTLGSSLLARMRCYPRPRFGTECPRPRATTIPLPCLPNATRDSATTDDRGSDEYMCVFRSMERP